MSIKEKENELTFNNFNNRYPNKSYDTFNNFYTSDDSLCDRISNQIGFELLMVRLFLTLLQSL